MYQYRDVISRMRLGATNRSLARAGVVGRKKAAQIREIAEKHGWLNRECPLPDDEMLSVMFGKGLQAARQKSLVAAYADEIETWWKDGINGTTIHEVLRRKHGFTGSYSSVRRFLQKLKDEHREVCAVLEFEPGEAAQVDFGQGPIIKDVYSGKAIRSWFFVMTLCWSRHLYAEIVRDQKVETWLGCHRRAFEFFGGVIAKVIIDNAKCAIIKACFHDPEVQRSYGEFAQEYGFQICPCPPREPKKKGRVESGVKYIKRSYLPLRDFRSISDANAQLRSWILETAGNRIHGTTRKQPLAAFSDVEKALLKPLPEVAPELAVWTRAKVHRNCHLQFEKCTYSVPHPLVGKRLWLKASEATIKIFDGLRMVATHPRGREPGQRFTVREHLPPGAVAYFTQDADWCLEKAQQVGPSCRQVLERLFSDRVLDNLRAAQGIIRLRKDYGDNRLEAACRRALAFEHVRYRAIKTILQKGLDQVPYEDAHRQRLSDVYAGQGRFVRDTGRFFIH